MEQDRIEDKQQEAEEDHGGAKVGSVLLEGGEDMEAPHHIEDVETLYILCLLELEVTLMAVWRHVQHLYTGPTDHPGGEPQIEEEHHYQRTCHVGPVGSLEAHHLIGYIHHTIISAVEHSSQSRAQWQTDSLSQDDVNML